MDAALSAGAAAFLLKSVRGDGISDAIHAVAEGRTLLDETRREAGQRASHVDLEGGRRTPSEGRAWPTSSPTASPTARSRIGSVSWRRQ